MLASTRVDEPFEGHFWCQMLFLRSTATNPDTTNYYFLVSTLVFYPFLEVIFGVKSYFN